MLFPQDLTKYQAYILNAVKDRNFDMSFTPIESVVGDDKATFFVSTDYLKIHNVRVMVTAKMQQEIADLLDCYLLTPKLADLRFHNTLIKLKPMPRPITAKIEVMIDQSSKIDAEIKKLGVGNGLVDTAGKNWIISNENLLRPGMATNYGWHFVGQNFMGIKGAVCDSQMKDSKGQYYRVIQMSAQAHNPSHLDYSQLCTLVKNQCLVNDNIMLLEDVFKDPQLSYLANHDGVLKFTRYKI